jgi:hypothetical protein
MKNDLTKELEAAKAREGCGDFVGYISAYCDSRGCTARDFEVKIKDHWDDDHPVSVCCPLCGKPPIINGVRTLSEHSDRADYEARCNVNVQRYVKRNGGGAVAVPVAIYFDDSLPKG